MHKKLLYLLFLYSYSQAATQPLPAVTIVPVANLAFQPIAPLFPNKTTAACYQEMSLEGTKNSTHSCPRAHQLLFNERVEIIDRTADEVLVRIPQCYYITAADRLSKKHEYWGLKSDFLPLANLEKQNLDTSLIPPAICFETKNNGPTNDLATLIVPHKDQNSSRVFSAGTRFVVARPLQPTDDVVWVWVFDPTTFQQRQMPLKKAHCLFHAPTNPAALRAAFVQLIRLWTETASGRFIPYVWGGASLTELVTQDMIKSPPSFDTKAHSSFALHDTKHCATGFDCSGVIVRAAHILHIPYFAKNSFTALTSLKPIRTYQELAEGDLIYIMGHLMIVADLKNNTLIEARSHYHGFGKLHEIKLNKEFKGMETYQQLLCAINAGKTLERLDASGKVMSRIQDAQLLKMPIELLASEQKA